MLSSLLVFIGPKGSSDPSIYFYRASALLEQYMCMCCIYCSICVRRCIYSFHPLRSLWLSLSNMPSSSQFYYIFVGVWSAFGDYLLHSLFIVVDLVHYSKCDALFTICNFVDIMLNICPLELHPLLLINCTIYLGIWSTLRYLWVSRYFVLDFVWEISEKRNIEVYIHIPSFCDRSCNICSLSMSEQYCSFW